MSLSVPEIKELVSDGAFREQFIPCPECYNMEDDQYTCTTCWTQGGGGQIMIDDVVNTLLEAVETEACGVLSLL